MLFGRAFEQALGAYSRREGLGDPFFRERSACRSSQPIVVVSSEPAIASENSALMGDNQKSRACCLIQKCYPTKSCFSR